MVTRRKFDKEFKLMVVNLCLSGQDPKDVALEMNLNSGMIHRWMRQQKEYGNNSFKGNGNAVMTSEQEQIARLVKELKQVRIEREILKKTVSIFSMSDGKNMNL